MVSAGFSSADEIDDNKVEHSVSEEEVSEGRLRRDRQEIPFVLRIDLYP